MLGKVISRLSYFMGVAFIVNYLLGIGEESWLSNGNVLIAVSLVLNYFSLEKDTPRKEVGFISGSCIFSLFLSLLSLIIKKEVISITLVIYSTLVFIVQSLWNGKRKELDNGRRNKGRG